MFLDKGKGGYIGQKLDCSLIDKKKTQPFPLEHIVICAKMGGEKMTRSKEGRKAPVKQ